MIKRDMKRYNNRWMNDDTIGLYFSLNLMFF